MSARGLGRQHAGGRGWRWGQSGCTPAPPRKGPGTETGMEAPHQGLPVLRTSANLASSAVVTGALGWGPAGAWMPLARGGCPARRDLTGFGPAGRGRGSSQPTGSHTRPEPAACLNTSTSSSWSQTAWVQILSPIYQLCHPEQVTSPLYISVSAKVNGDDDKRAYIKGPGEDRMREPMEDR